MDKNKYQQPFVLFVMMLMNKTNSTGHAILLGLLGLLRNESEIYPAMDGRGEEGRGT